MSFNVMPMKPLSKKGKRTLHIVALVSAATFIPLVLLQSLLSILPGLVLFFTLWASFGDFIHTLCWEKEQRELDDFDLNAWCSSWTKKF